MLKSTRPFLLAFALGSTAFFTYAAMADGTKNYPAFTSIAQGKKMLSRDEINKLDETKYPQLKDLKSHFDDADLDHDGNINQYEYDHFMAQEPH